MGDKTVNIDHSLHVWHPVERQEREAMIRHSDTGIYCPL